MRLSMEWKSFYVNLTPPDCRLLRSDQGLKKRLKCQRSSEEQRPVISVRRKCMLWHHLTYSMRHSYRNNVLIYVYGKINSVLGAVACWFMCMRVWVGWISGTFNFKEDLKPQMQPSKSKLAGRNLCDAVILQSMLSCFLLPQRLWCFLH